MVFSIVELVFALFGFIALLFVALICGYGIGVTAEAKKHGFRDLDGRYHCTDCQKVEAK